MRYHSIRTVYAISVSMGFLSRRLLLEPLGASQLCDRSGRFVLLCCQGIQLSRLTEPAVSAFMDLYLAVYPATVLAKLQMSIKKKFAFSIALGIGAVGGIVAAYKCTRLPGLAEEDFSCRHSRPRQTPESADGYC